VQPILLELGPLKIHAYGFALALAFLIGSLWVSRRGRLLGYREDQLSRLFLWVLASSLIGARLYYGFQHPEDFRDDWISVFRVWQGGLTQHGGIVAAILVAWLFVRSRGWRFREIADLTAPALALGEGITRIGCFFAGCCHGTPTEFAWGICYPPGAAAHWVFGGAPVHPSPLLLACGNLLLFLLLARLQSSWIGSGRLFALYLLCSSVLRFLVDLTRYYIAGDSLAVFGLRLAHSQWLSLALILFALLLWWRTPPPRRPAQEESPPRPAPR
jgi:phosphatidylglycerol:prolipoprotein diacylglycerol transferase